jgi:3-oxoacid CoA-transferase
MIIYDADIALYTPLRLWLSSGIRALDHAIEALYNPFTSETPHRLLSLSTSHELFTLLRKSKDDPTNADIRQRLQMVAFGTMFSFSFKGGLGLSHSMGSIKSRALLMIGHALGATYQIPHGITSCLTLAPVLRQKALKNPAEASQIARLVPFLELPWKPTDKENAVSVADSVEHLVEELGLKSTLTEYKVPHTQGEMEAIAEWTLHTKEGDEFKSVVEILKGLY